jgi:general secretion pathway protein L
MTISPGLEGSQDHALNMLWRNWRAEWKVVFDKIRLWLLPDDPALVTFDLSRSGALLLERNGAVLGRLEGESIADQQEIASILDRNGIQGSFDVMLRLPRRELLSRRIELPYISSASLKGALQYELERLTPLPPSRLYFDFYTQTQDRKANQTVIEARLIKRETVDDAVTLAHAAGAVITAIRFEGESRDADWRNFPIDRSALLRHLWNRFGLVLCCASTASLLGSLLISVYAREAALNATYAEELMQARSQTRAIVLLNRKIHDAETALSFPVRQKSRPLVVSTLAALTQALPDNSWIGELELSNGQLRLHGTSQSASDLIAALDRSGHFAHATFTAPIVRNPQDKNDHFDLAASVVSTTP